MSKSRIFETTKSKKILKYYLPRKFDDNYVEDGEYMDILHKISELKEDDEFELVIDYCSGGYCHVANCLKLQIEKLKCSKKCSVINNSYSASNIVLSAFDVSEIDISETSLFMFHDVSVHHYGNINNVNNYISKENIVSERILNDFRIFMNDESIEKYTSGGDVYLLGRDVIHNIERNLQEENE